MDGEGPNITNDGVFFPNTSLTPDELRAKYAEYLARFLASQGVTDGGTGEDDPYEDLRDELLFPPLDLTPEELALWETLSASLVDVATLRYRGRRRVFFSFLDVIRFVLRTGLSDFQIARGKDDTAGTIFIVGTRRG